MPLRQRRRRRQTPGRFKLRQAPWSDPFPHIPGTEPEKRIFAALYDRRIFFIFQGQVPELERGLYVTLAVPGYKPDFVIPEYKVIIDPFSPYHHSLPDAIRRDAEKVALYTALGYRYYHPWAIAPGVFLFDQNVWARRKTDEGWRVKDVGDLRGLRGSAADVISWIPELRGRKKAELTDKQKRLARNPGFELGPYLGAGANSVAAANRSRTRPKPLSIASGTRRRTRRRSL